MRPIEEILPEPIVDELFPDAYRPDIPGDIRFADRNAWCVSIAPANDLFPQSLRVDPPIRRVIRYRTPTERMEALRLVPDAPSPRDERLESSGVQPYALSDDQTFALSHTREFEADDPGAGALDFIAPRGYRWHWYHRHALSPQGLVVTLEDVLALLHRSHWQWAIATHVRALEAAFLERESITAMLDATEDDADRPTPELIASVMTVYRNVESLIEELAGARQLFLDTG